MKKLLLPVAAVFILALFGCTPDAPPETETETPPEVNTDIVAIVDDELILKDEVLSYVLEYYSSMNFDLDELTDEEKNELYSYALKDMVSGLVERHKADELGYTALSAEDAALAEEYRQQLFDERYAYFYDETAAQMPDADENTLIESTDAAVLSYIRQSGETDEYVLQMYVYEIALSNMYDSLTADAEVTGEELLDGYDERVAEDKEIYTEHPDYFASDKTTNLVYYNLPGYRYVKHILLTDEQTAANVRRLADSEDFDALMAEYTVDAGSTDFINGFAVCEGCELYAEGYSEAAMALESPGDISDVVELSDGFYVIKYVSDIPAGAESLDSVREYLTDELLEQKRSDMYANMLAEWTDEADITYFYDILYS